MQSDWVSCSLMQVLLGTYMIIIVFLSPLPPPSVSLCFFPTPPTHSTNLLPRISLLS